MFIFTLILAIITVIKTEHLQDFEVVRLPLSHFNDQLEVPISFTVFGQKIDLELKRNDILLSPRFQVWRHNESGLEKVPELSKFISCHYLHKDEESSAALSFCQRRTVEGFILFDNETFEISPVKFSTSREDHIIKGRSDDFLGEPHIVKRAFIPNGQSDFLSKKFSDSLFFSAEEEEEKVKNPFENFNEDFFGSTVSKPEFPKRYYSKGKLSENPEVIPQKLYESDSDFDFLENQVDIERLDVDLEPRVVKRAFPRKRKFGKNSGFDPWKMGKKFLARNQRNYGKRKALTLELAVFFDEPGYRLFAPYLDRDEEKMRDMLLAYVNGIQAIYHHPSLGVDIDISLIRLDLMERQPHDLPHYNGERGSLLDSFCDYAKKHNPKSDEDPYHWDMGLYISGLDFHVMENGRKNSVTMGLATVGGVCIDEYSCVIAELGVTNRFGKPYPSAGFTSVYIAAHEIGHNLGMHHDSTSNSCPKDGYIMSPSRGTQGETVWSECSRSVALNLGQSKPCLLDRSALAYDKSLDHVKFLELPGRVWSAKEQCEVLLRDKDATAITSNLVCDSLQCKTPHRSGYYFAGPALDGTHCSSGRECRGGECVQKLQFTGSSGSDNRVVEGGWSTWRREPCKSGCIEKSRGFQQRHRLCNNPPPKNTDAGCEGLAYDVVLCPDGGLCPKDDQRETIIEFATRKCQEFSQRLSVLDKDGIGLQAPHEAIRPWMSCAIFCKRRDIQSYYTPRIELNDLGLDPYFPDGTWCHFESGQDYYCRQHHCLPETFSFQKLVLKSFANTRTNDLTLVDLGPQNARPGDNISEQLIKYHSLSANGFPLLTSLSPSVTNPPNEDDWTDKDYVELPRVM